MRQYVGLGDPAVPAAAGNTCGVEVMLLDQPAHRGRELVGTAGRRCAPGFRRGRPPLRSLGGLCSGRCSRGGALLQDREHLPAGDRRTVLYFDFLDHAGGRRRHLEHDLVGLEVNKVLVALH